MAIVLATDIEVEVIPPRDMGLPLRGGPSIAPSTEPFEIKALYKYGRLPVFWQPNNWAYLTHATTMELPIQHGRIYDFVEIRAGGESLRMASVIVDSIEVTNDRIGPPSCLVSMRCPADFSRHSGMVLYS